MERNGKDRSGGKKRERKEKCKGKKKGNGSPREIKHLNDLGILSIFLAYSELKSL